jgi:hypothetical protein
LKDYGNVVEIGKKKLKINTQCDSIEWKQILREVLQKLASDFEGADEQKALVRG